MADCQPGAAQPGAPESIHELRKHMQELSDRMGDAYKRIRAWSREDPGTAGDQGENDWAKLFREWLPPEYIVVTKGRLLYLDGTKSKQMDVIILHPGYPTALVNEKHYLVGGVVAAFECKVTLRPRDVVEAMRRLTDVKRKLASDTADLGHLRSPYRELYVPIVLGILAHSHTWKLKNTLELVRLTWGFVEADNGISDHPREVVDLICVADLVCWRTHMFINKIDDEFEVSTAYMYDTPPYLWSEKLREAVLAVPPVAGLLSSLMRRLAWNSPGNRSLANHFTFAAKAGAAGGPLREWEEQVFTPETYKKIKNGDLKPYFPYRWEEWGRSFP